MILLESWKQSLGLLAPKILFGILKQVKFRFIKTVLDVVSLLKWVIVVDCLIFLLFGKEFTVALEQIATHTPTQPIPFSVTLLSIVVSITLFLLQGSFLIFVRKSHNNQGYTLREYFRIYFIRYVQLALFFSLLFVFILSFLMSIGITKLPAVHWGFVFFLKIVELLILFYWLDTGFSFKEMLYSCERGLNFFFYNLPLFFVVFGVVMIGWMLSAKIMALVSLDMLLPTKVIAHNLIYKSISNIATVLVRYGRIGGEFVWITVLFVMYQRRKQISYNKSLFEEE